MHEGWQESCGICSHRLADETDSRLTCSDRLSCLWLRPTSPSNILRGTVRTRRYGRCSWRVASHLLRLRPFSSPVSFQLVSWQAYAAAVFSGYRTSWFQPTTYKEISSSLPSSPSQHQHPHIVSLSESVALKSKSLHVIILNQGDASIYGLQRPPKLVSRPSNYR